jgi:CheY-like chemotaxis protein
MARILLIDDDACVRDSLAAALRHFGHAVTEAADGAAGLRVFGSQPAELVLTDIVMPERDGLDVIRHLRSAAPAARIIAMSGASTHAPDLYLRMAVQFGADATLAKPIALDALRRTVDEVLLRRAAGGA